MAELGAAIRSAVGDPGSVPGSARELVRYVGGADELVRVLTGARARPRDVEGRRAWDSARRRVQRQTTTTGAQKRGGKRPFTLTVAQRRRARRVAVQRKWARLLREGARFRVTGEIRIDSPGIGHRADVRERSLPSGGPGVLLSPDDVAALLEAVEDDDDAAAEEAIYAALEAWGMPPDVEIENVSALTIWPEGDREP